MGFGELPAAEKQALLEAYRVGGLEAIRGKARELGIKPRSLARRLQERAVLLEELRQMGMVIRPSPRHKLDFQWEQLCRSFGRDPGRPKPVPAPAKHTDRRIVCVFADVHGRFNVEALEAMLDREAPDITVLAGDALDNFAFSRFSQFGFEDPLEEVSHVAGIYEAKILPVTAYNYILGGNHDSRYLDYFADRVDAWAMGYLKEPPLREIAKHFSNLEVVEQWLDFTTPTGQVFPEAFKQDFFLVLGDALIAHPEIARKHPGASARAFLERWGWWGPNLGFPKPALLAVGHKHTWSHTPGAWGVDLIELGYFGHPSRLQYLFDKAQLSEYTPQPGYLVFEQEHHRDGRWVTDIRSIHYQRT